jgi:hypothetical protein
MPRNFFSLSRRDEGAQHAWTYLTVILSAPVASGLLFFLFYRIYLKASARIFIGKYFPICRFIISTVFKNPFSKMNVF